MLRAILFDFNGVLVDDEPIHFELFRQVLEQEGLGLSRERYYSDFLGFDDRGAFTAAYQAAGQPIDTVLLTRLITRKASYYRERIRRDGYPFFGGAARLVAAASESDYILGVVSGALRVEIEDALDQLGLKSAMKVIVAAEDVAESKPDPEGYRRAIETLNRRPPLPERLIHPHEVLAIEDSPAGLQSANQAGLRTLGVAQTYDADQLADAEQVIEGLTHFDLADLPNLFP